MKKNQKREGKTTHTAKLNYLFLSRNVINQNFQHVKDTKIQRNNRISIATKTLGTNLRLLCIEATRNTMIFKPQKRSTEGKWENS